MPSDPPVIYWDACVPLSYINGRADRLPQIEALMQQSGKDCHIITSVLSVTEVAFAKVEQDEKSLDPEVEEKISKLWQVGSPIQLVEFYEVIAVKAQKLMRAAIAKGWNLKPGDAIHLATADHIKKGGKNVTEFHTYDEGLEKYEELTEARFKICRPTAAQPVLAFQDTEAQHDNKGKPSQAETAEPVPAEIRGSDSGRVEGQAGTEEAKAIDPEEGG